MQNSKIVNAVLRLCALFMKSKDAKMKSLKGAILVLKT